MTQVKEGESALVGAKGIVRSIWVLDGYHGIVTKTLKTFQDLLCKLVTFFFHKALNYTKPSFGLLHLQIFSTITR
jgi:hypothetical protein